MPNIPAPRSPAIRPLPKPKRRGCAPAPIGPGRDRPGLIVSVRCIDWTELGAVAVGAGALNVREPRDPKEAPPPGRASAVPRAMTAVSPAIASVRTSEDVRDEVCVRIPEPERDDPAAG